MKKLDLSFCESLICSDFFLINHNITRDSYNITKVVMFGNIKLMSLDILNIYKELQQLIRFIIFLRLKRSRKKNKLVLGIKEVQEAFLLKMYFKNYFVNYNFLISELERVSEINKARRLNVGLLSFFSISNVFEKHLHYYKIFLLSMFDIGNFIQKEASVYRIYNKLDSYRKILFFVAILENIFKVEKV